MSSFATSYIPTASAATTRAAETAVIDGQAFTDFYNQEEGTVVSTWKSAGSLGSSLISFALSDGTFNNSAYQIASASGAGNATSTGVVKSGVAQANISHPSTVAYVNYAEKSTAFAYKTNDFAGTGDGGAISSDTLGTPPTVNRLYLGANWVGTGNKINGTIKSLTYWPKRLSNAVLQALTS